MSRKIIYIQNIDPAVKKALVNYSENLGYPTFNKFQIDFLKETIEKYEPQTVEIDKKVPQILEENDTKKIYIQSVPKLIHARLLNISSKLGFKSVSELLRFEMHMKCSGQPAHMLKKNKGFQELPEPIKAR